MKAKALKRFKDLKEKKIRSKGEEFEVSEDRFKEINSTRNGQLVEKITDTPVKSSDFPKHTGGGWYELSNAEKVKGKDNASKAEKEL